MPPWKRLQYLGKMYQKRTNLFAGMTQSCKTCKEEHFEDWCHTMWKVLSRLQVTFYKIIHGLIFVKDVMPNIQNQHQVWMGKETHKRRVGAPLTSTPNMIEPIIVEETWKKQISYGWRKFTPSSLFVGTWWFFPKLKHFLSLMQKLGQPIDNNQE